MIKNVKKYKNMNNYLYKNNENWMKLNIKAPFLIFSKINESIIR